MKSDLSFFRLFFSVLIHPRKTIQLILDNDPGYYVWPMVITLSALEAINPYFFNMLNNYVAAPLAILGQVVLGMGGGVVIFLFLSWIVYQSGKWMGGVGNYREVRTSLAWGYFPVHFLERFFP